MTESGNNIERDLTLTEVAEVLGMSERWIRNEIHNVGAEHQRYGNRIRFTPAQVAQLRDRYKHVNPVVPLPITTGPRKSWQR